MITGPGENLDVRRWKASRDSLKFAAHNEAVVEEDGLMAKVLGLVKCA